MKRGMKLPHPGGSILYFCLEPLGLSVDKGAEALGVSVEHLSDVIDGRAGISPEMAIRLDKAFGGGAETWHRLQAAYDMERALERADCIRLKRAEADYGEGNDEMKRGMKLLHPGESILLDCLEPLCLSVAKGADALGVSVEYLSDVIDGRAGISPEMAIRLDKAFGGGAETWHRLQAAYDMEQALERADSIQVERVVAAGAAD